jgi:salicylate hydroxylase
MNNAKSSGTIAIAGAGIAGLSAAIALKHEGFPVAIFEREKTLEPIGAGIQMGPNATRIMEGWELDLLGASFEPEAIELHNAVSGALLNTIPLRRAARERYGSPYVTLLRADLQKALFNRAVELGIAIKYGAPVVRAIEGRDSVEIEAGGQVSSVAALIGADGLNSSVRTFFEFPPRRIPAHAVAWRALVPVSAVPAPMRSMICLWMADGAHLVHYPVAGGAKMNAVLVIDDVHRADVESDGREVMPYLLSRTQAWAEVPHSIVASTESWLHWRMAGVERWDGGAGRIQVIGDAWHAMRPYLASGGVMAIEDGAALANCLTAAPGNVVAALSAFRYNRASRVWRVVSASAQTGRIYHCPPPFDLVRDLAIKAATGEQLLSRNDWLYGVQREGRPSVR